MAEATTVSSARPVRFPAWFLVSACVAVSAGGLVLLGEPLAAALVVVIPLIPYVFYGTLRGIAGDREFGSVIAAVVVFVLCANFRYREYGEKSVDFQVALKLLALMVALGLSLLAIRAIVRHLYFYGLAYWLAFYVWLVISATYAIAPAHAGIATLSLLTSFLYLCYLCVKFGPFRMIEVLVWAGLLMCVGSLVVYVAVPSFGRMRDWVGTEQVLTNRLQGIFGASNGAGSAAGTLLFLTAVYYVGHPRASRFLGYATLATSLLCLILSNNRMAIICLAVSGTVYWLISGHFGRKLLFLLSAGMLLVLPVLLFPDQIFSMLSRTGSAEEITSGTGRSRIWAVVLELIPQAWLIGRGYASAQHILPIHPDLFEAAAHCHNLYLELLFSSGIIGLILFVWCILTSIVLTIRVGGARELALFFFFLPYGLTEPIIGGTTYLGLINWQAAIVLLFYRANEFELANARVVPPAVGKARDVPV